MCSATELRDWHAERVLWVIVAVIVGMLAVVTLWPRNYDPKPDAHYVEIGTARYCLANNETGITACFDSEH